MIQIFTSPPQRWAPRPLPDDEAEAFRRARKRSRPSVCAAHDSYLINLATEDTDLFRRSRAAFIGELERCERLRLDFLVTHPGHATGGDRTAALRRNAEAIGEALGEVPGRVRVLVETTAGSGTVLGWRFDELADLLSAIPPPHGERVGVCLDTAHVFAAGYDLDRAYESVVLELAQAIGIERIGLLHLNDSRTACGSRVDRHAEIGAGALGETAFARLLRDPRFGGIPGVLETPKGTDPVAADRRNLATLRRLAGLPEVAFPAP